MVSTATVRKVLLGAILAVGLALMTLALQGMVRLDGQLSNAAERTAPSRGLPVTDDHDCPWRDREREAPRGTGVEA